MKKIFVLLALLAGALSMKAQTVNGILIKDIDSDYMQIVGTAKFMSTKLSILLDFGQNTKLFSGGKETIVKDENGKNMEFNSMVDALNFFSKHGYEFASAYVVTVGNQNVYHYLLKKKKE